jgi:hypothetical protein
MAWKTIQRFYVIVLAANCGNYVSGFLAPSNPGLGHFSGKIGAKAVDMAQPTRQSQNLQISMGRIGSRKSIEEYGNQVLVQNSKKSLEVNSLIDIRE